MTLRARVSHIGFPGNDQERLKTHKAAPLMEVPAMVLFAGVLFVAALSDRLTAWPLVLASSFFWAGLLLIARRGMPGESFFMVFLTICFLFAGSFCYARSQRPSPPEWVEGTGTIQDARPWGRGYVFVIATDERKFLASGWGPGPRHFEGERVAVRGRTVPLKDTSRGDSTFREDRYWGARGMAARLVSPEISHLAEQPMNLYRLRYLLHRTFVIQLPHLVRAYLDAFWT
jgi:hypothetical protein